jgi:hypothetical protein
LIQCELTKKPQPFLHSLVSGCALEAVVGDESELIAIFLLRLCLAAVNVVA